MTASQVPFPTIERVDVDPVAIAAYTREWDFMVLGSELLREVASYVCVAACTLGQAPTWARDQAAVGGNMVRLYKLLSAFLDQTVQINSRQARSLAVWHLRPSLMPSI